MAEPVKIKFEYQNPANVEAEVPGSQKLRKPQNYSSNDAENSSSYTENSSSNAENSSSNAESSKDNSHTRRIISSYTEVRSELTEDGKVIRRHHQVITGDTNGEPVMMEDRQVEEKKPRTKIPVSKFRQTVERVKAERRSSKDKKEHESHIPIRRTSIPKPKDSKPPVTTVKKELTITRTEIKHQTTEPDDEFDKIYAEMVDNTPTEVKFDENILNLKVEDPEKLESTFEEIIHDYDEHRVEPIDVEKVRRSKIPFLKRRSQQEIDLSVQADRTSKIIAARDKLRLRHSLNSNDNFEDELDREIKKTQGDSNNQDSNHENKDETPVKDNDASKDDSQDTASNAGTPVTDTKTEKEFKHEVISSPTSKKEVKTEFTKTISTSSSRESETSRSSSVVETTTVKEVKTNESKAKEENKQFIIEENIVKGSIKIGIPVFSSHVHEFSENTESSKTVEMKSVLSYTSKSEDLSISNNVTETKNELKETEIKTSENNVETPKTKSFEINVSYAKNTDSQTEELQNTDKRTKEIPKENIEYKSPDSNDLKQTKEEAATHKEDEIEESILLRGKVGKLISKIDSKELIETESNKRESINELTKKKSVLSKIAMFERTEPESPVKSKLQRKEITPIVINKEVQRVEHVHIDTPLIVDHVFKPFQADIELNNGGNKEENPVKIDDRLTAIVRAEPAKINSKSVLNSVSNKVDIDSKPAEENKILKETVSIQTKTETQSKVVEINAHVIVDSEYSREKVEFLSGKYAMLSEESEKLNDKQDMPFDRLKSTDVKDKEVIPTDIAKDTTDKDKETIPTDETTKPNEIQTDPVTTIPGFRTVSELLRSFENKNVKRSLTKRHISRETSVRETRTPVNTPEIRLFSSAEGFNFQEDVIEENYESINDFKSFDEVFTRESDLLKLKLRQEEDLRRAKSLAELDLGDAVKGKVNNMISRMTSVDRVELDKKEAVISVKEMPRKRSVSEKIALFEGKLTPSRSDTPPLRIFKYDKNLTEATRKEKKLENTLTRTELSSIKRVEIEREKHVTEVNGTENVERNDKSDEELLQKKIEELRNAKQKYGKVMNMPGIELSNGQVMPVLAVGTALLDPRLIYHIITAAIDLGYRAIDTAFIYGNEKQVGEAIKAKIDDGTVTRDELFVISKLWSTYHRTDLVEAACKASLKALGLEYFDLYLIHNPMSFKEGGNPIPKIATVIQYSEYDYLDAWFGMERLVTKGLVRGIGVSNFNSVQLQRILDKGRVKPVVNQVECHPYLSQHRLDQFCSERKVTLSCFGVLGSKGTPLEYKSGQSAAIDDALVQVMASGLNMTAAQLLIRYQLENGHGVVLKSSSAAHLWDNLQSVTLRLSMVEIDALNALNRNKRTFTFRGMGETHRNYPFNVAF